MEISFKCDLCGGDVTAPGDMAGREMTCPNSECGCSLTVPSGSTPTVEVPKQGGDISFDCPFCQNELVVDMEGAGLEVECPKCGNMISVPDPAAAGAPVEGAAPAWTPPPPPPPVPRPAKRARTVVAAPSGVPPEPSAVSVEPFARETGGDGTERPVVLEMQPANNADAVDPQTAELRVTFSVPMSGGFSWTGGGNSYPALADGARPYWTEDRRTCVFPVSLEPNHRYRLGLNSASHKRFRSAGGVPLDPVTYSFRTGW